MLTCSIVLLALFASTQGRAVNISNTWVLPEEGFPVFYRYFRDRISWYEADAVCQFHHANLVTVDTTAQYDAVRAYLKELDISSAVWVGLIRSNPDGDFTWTDYRGLSSDGYWSSAPDGRAAPLCAAADPAADYRWEARACGGPTVASFICELPVPQWALGNEGCMVRELPALTVLYLPESAAVQLTADCGLAGVKRVQCTGNVKRDDLLRDLSCAEEEEISSTLTATSVGTAWQTTADTTFTDQDTTNEITTEELITTEHEDEINKTNMNEAISTAHSFTEEHDNLPSKQPVKINKLNVFSQKNVNLDLMLNNNLQSNDIPKLVNNENFLTLEQSEKLEDEKLMHHKMLHDELARHGNFETIFTQPTDHFVPPLVMAKAKISDDMTVLSLAEKHAQQLAEQRFAKHNMHVDQKDYLHVDNDKSVVKSTTDEPNNLDITDKPMVSTLQLVKVKEYEKKDKVKSSVPKKYKEKYDDPKRRNLKIDNKLLKFEKSTEAPSIQTKAMVKSIETTTNLVTKTDKGNLEEDSTIDLTVVLKEPKINNTVKLLTINYTNDESKIEVIRNKTEVELETKNVSIVTGATEIYQGTSVESQTEKMHGVSMNDEIIKITIINDERGNTTPTVFEITTRMPHYREDVNNIKTLPKVTQQPHAVIIDSNDATSTLINNNATAPIGTMGTSQEHFETTSVPITTVSTTLSFQDERHSYAEKKYYYTTEEPLTIRTELPIVTSTTFSIETNTTEKYINKTAITTTNNLNVTAREKTNVFNNTGEHNEKNSTGSSDTIDDFQSPLLSAANEPLHRPVRMRRPQQPPNRLNKFNPFRILG